MFVARTANKPRVKCNPRVKYKLEDIPTVQAVWADDDDDEEEEEMEEDDEDEDDEYM